jgi:hypothetical protein
MKTRFLTLLGLVGLLSGGFLLVDELDARSNPGEIIERQVNANLMQVRIGGRWVNFPLIPLAPQACQNGDSHFKKYCP